ncbi:MAG TPA: prenyltransferase/squalene oxidase repeat-containing protein [Gemmataceae bacterium]|nr:prenyltransferase/squalene oxidase repeat-containing protein [Gemmataceae bacterium]
MKLQRALAVVLLVMLPAAWAAVGQDAPKEAKPKSPFAEKGPRPDPVPRPDPAAVEVSIKRGIDFLIANQNKNGSWGSPAYRHGVTIYAPIPGAHRAFQSAVTAMCISALIETAGERDDARKTLERGETWLMENLPKVRRSSPDALYNIWSHIYGIQAFVRMHQRLPDEARRRKMEALIREQIGFLVRYESVDKGWGYYDFRIGSQRPATDSTSFMTAAALVALREAKDIGIELPAKLAPEAVDSIQRQRKPDNSYLYGEYMKYVPQDEINQPGGSLGRSQACNLALRLWGDETITDKVMTTWLDRLFARNGWLDMARKKPIPHESHYAVAGYFFYFGHYYAGLAIGHVPESQRPFYQDHLATLLLRLQSKDGSWWDYPLYNYHQQYGTAFALMSLKRCRR